jgi:hypothetical protein
MNEQMPKNVQERDPYALIETIESTETPPEAPVAEEEAPEETKEALEERMAKAEAEIEALKEQILAKIDNSESLGEHTELKNLKLGEEVYFEGAIYEVSDLGMKRDNSKPWEHGDQGERKPTDDEISRMITIRSGGTAIGVGEQMVTKIGSPLEKERIMKMINNR